MKKTKIMIAAIAMFAAAGIAVGANADTAMYRLYNPNSGEHFYTAQAAEQANLISVGWRDEGTGWVAPDSGAPVYRLYNKNAGDHFYTLDANEKNHLVSVGWNDEGIGWYSGGNIPLYRAYNPNAKAGSHNYTTGTFEQQNLIQNGWRDEKIGWYGVGIGQTKPAPVASDYLVPSDQDSILEKLNRDAERASQVPYYNLYQK